MKILGRLGGYGLLLVAVFGIAFWIGTLVGPIELESTPMTTQEQEQ